MRKPLRSITGLAAAGLLALAVVPSNAAPRAERELLGIRIWNKYSDVLSRFGQPTRIENGLVTSSGEGGQTVAGGAPGMGGMPGMPGGMGPRMGGMMGSGGPMGMGMGGRMGSGGPMGGMPGMPGGMMGSGGGKMGAMMGGMGMPGSGGPMGMGMPGMPGGMGGESMGGMGGGEQAASADEEVTWVYEHKGKSPVTDFFLFNRDGRLIQAGSFGYSGGAITSRGVHLGDPVAKIFATYGFTGNMVKDAARSTMTLDYSKEKNVAFQLLDRHNGLGYRVVGITVGLTDKSEIPGNNTEDNSR
jgi:hypothetical protein